MVKLNKRMVEASDEGSKWIAMVKKEVDGCIKDLEPEKAYGSLIYLEKTMGEALLYLRQKRVAHANKYKFKHV